LTGLLLPQLLAAPGARVVTVSSNGHKAGRIDFADLQRQRKYGKWTAYCGSKLANLLFAYDLQRRLAAAGSPVISVAAHPGSSATNLAAAGSQDTILMRAVMPLGSRLVGQSAAKGALPQLYAATAPDVVGAEYFGPHGPGELWGYPRRVTSTQASRDLLAAGLLWSASEELTGVSYDHYLG
jgi:NAD(P)-dependent dehydrogenase (short-subunit alcohol dehydrogenase family)